jgi:hypothetical protein
MPPKNGVFYILGLTTEQSATVSCLATEFYCDNKCIPKAWECDDFDDCNDKTDELHCGKIIKS